MSPLTRKTPMRRTAMKPYQWKPAVPAETRELLVARSGGWCEAQLPGCRGGGSDTHHRKTQKSGGRRGAAKVKHDELANVMDLCRSCHTWIGVRVEEAKDMGLALEEHVEPGAEFVAYRGVLSYLTNDGRVLDYFETTGRAVLAAHPEQESTNVT